MPGATSWVSPPPDVSQRGNAGVHLCARPSALLGVRSRMGQRFAVPLSPPAPSIFYLCLYRGAASCIPPSPTSSLPSPSYSTTEVLCPPLPPPRYPRSTHPLRLPRMAPTHRQRHEGGEDANLESGPLRRGCRGWGRPPSAGVGRRSRERGWRVRAAPSPAVAGEPEKKRRGGGIKIASAVPLVQAWERGCVGASLSAARGDRRRPLPERRRPMGARRGAGGEREAAALPTTWSDGWRDGGMDGWMPPPVAIWELVISSDA